MMKTVSNDHRIPVWQAALATIMIAALFAVSLPACAATAPALKFSPSSVNFGAVKVGQSATASVTIRSTGTSTLQTSLIQITGPQAGQFTSNDKDWYTLRPGVSVTFQVTYKPTVAAAATASFQVTSNDPRGVLGITLTGQGTAATTAPALTVAPTSVSFGSVAVGATSAASTVQLSNTGTAALSVSSLTLTGANPGDFVLAPAALPLQIAAGASAGVSVTCKPTAAGARTASLAVGSNNPGGTVTVPLSAQATTVTTAPKLAVSPTSLAFGSVAVGAASAASTVQLSNTGTAALSVSSLTLTGANPGDFVLAAATLPLQIAAGASASLSVTCKPSAAGTRTASLAIDSNNPAGIVAVALTGQGTTTTAAPKAQLSPTSLDFGSVAVGQSASKTFTVMSAGTQTLQTSSIQITGAQAAAFTSSDADWYTLGPGVSVTFTVTFKPTASGTATAQIEVTSNDPAGKAILPLSGSGTGTTAQPLLQVAPAAVSFGSVAVGATSAASTVQLSNTGTAALSVTSLALSGTNPADFTLSAPAMPLQIAAGAYANVTLTFKPAAAGTRSATLTVASNNPSGNVTVALTGSGAAAAQPLLQVSPASLSFGSVAVGATSAASTVQLSNTGTAALSVTSLALSGANAAEFTLAAPALPLQIAAGASAGITATFKPAAVGTRSATLTIGSNNPSGSVAVALSGTAPASPGTGSHPNDGSVLGTNLSPISDWSPEWAFVDCFKTSRDWMSGEIWVFQDSRALPRDANGWVTSLQSGQVARTLLFWEQANTYPSGDYTVLYDGSGTLAYQGAATKVSGTAGRDVVRVDASKGGWQLLITATTPGDYLRNIRVIMPGGRSTQDPYSWYADAASCPYGDYKSFEQTYQAQPFHPMFLNTIKNYKVLRFMDWMDTNDSTQTNWTDRPTPADARWSLKGVPVETMCSLANTIHADPWFNLPHLATDDYFAKFAAVVRDQLAPDLQAYIEYSNEVWNGQFQQALYAQQQGMALGLNANLYMAQSSFTSLRSVQMFAVFEQVLGGTSRIKRVMATQAAGWYLGELQLSYNNAYQHADVLAIAPYFGVGYGNPSNAGTTQSMTLDQLFASINSSELPGVYTWMDANAKLAAKYGLEFAAYEAGQSLMGYLGTENNDALTALFTAANRDPRMGQVYTDYMNKWKSYGGGMIVHYLNCLNSTKWGYWGSIERLDQTQTPKYTALQQYIENNR